MNLINKDINNTKNHSTKKNNKREGLDNLCRDFFSNLPHPSAVVTEEGGLLVVNKHFHELFEEDSISNKKLRSFYENIISNKNISSFKKRLDISGELKTLKIDKVKLSDSEDSSYYGIIIQDISYSEKFQQKLLKEVNTDSLTGLYSKRYIKKSINTFINNNKAFTYLHLDFDKFKLINDGLGKRIGDKVLQNIAQKIKYFFKSEKTVISRLGSDEFGVLIENQDKIGETAVMVQKLIKEIGKSIFVNKNEIFVSLSVGIIDNKIMNGGGSADDYMRDAEIALHKAKTLGRGKYKIFDKKMYYSILEQCNLELALQKAYKNNEFKVFYQPIFSLEQMKITSLETLIRWDHKRLGYVSPGKFMSSAEDLGLIRDLDRDTLEKGFNKIVAINNNLNTDISISINISALEFSTSTITKYLKEIIAKTKIRPEIVSLEITESVLLSDVQGAKETMKELKDLGVKITLDDFGTGFASLSYLRKLPIDTLKIDKSFINDITKDKSAVAIIRMLIDLGKELNLKIITEGVETKQQFEILSKLGCQHIQGYYLSKPINEDRLEEFLVKQIKK